MVWELRGSAFVKKTTAVFFSHKVLLISNFQFALIDYYALKFFRYSAGKKTLKENLFNRQYSVALINLILAIFIITMKNSETETQKLRNEMKKEKKDVILVISII